MKKRAVKKEKGLSRERGQVTVFIIIAILVVVGGGVGYYFIKNNSDNASKDFFSRSDIKPTMDSIKSSIITCSESSAKGSLDKIGIQGGYYTKPAKAFDLGWAFIPYYYDKGSFLMPEKVIIEKELAKEYDKEFLGCFKGINATGFEIKKGSSKTKVSILKGRVDFSLDMPVTLTKEENSMKIQMKDASISKPSKLYEIIEIGRYITDSHKNDSEMICVTCVADMAEERDVYVYAFDVKDNSVLMLVMDNRTASEPYYFEWLNRYSLQAIEERQIPAVPVPAGAT